MKFWERFNNIAYVLVLAGFVGFGVYSVANMVVRFGAGEAMNQIGFMALTFLSLAVLYEAVRAIKARGVPEKWWLSIAIALTVPLFFLGAVAAATPPIGAWTFYVVVFVMTSIVFQKLTAYFDAKKAGDTTKKKSS